MIPAQEWGFLWSTGQVFVRFEVADIFSSVCIAYTDYLIIALDKKWFQNPFLPTYFHIWLQPRHHMFNLQQHKTLHWFQLMELATSSSTRLWKRNRWNGSFACWGVGLRWNYPSFRRCQGPPLAGCCTCLRGFEEGGTGPVKIHTPKKNWITFR